MFIKLIILEGVGGINIDENRVLKITERLSTLKEFTAPRNCS